MEGVGRYSVQSWNRSIYNGGENTKKEKAIVSESSHDNIDVHGHDNIEIGCSDGPSADSHNLFIHFQARRALSNDLDGATEKFN